MKICKNKTYKVISSFGFEGIYIEHFNTLECAKETFDKAVKDECKFCYLLETEVSYKNDSVNKILKSYKS